MKQKLAIRMCNWSAIWRYCASGVMANTLVNDAAIENVIAYIQSLPDNPAPATIEGDTDRGERTYAVCAYCHGVDAMGIQAMGAPRLAGMTDWYLASQLANFRDDLRGYHPNDFFGMQMAFMARSLHDQEAIDNVIAYINTLK